MPSPSTDTPADSAALARALAAQLDAELIETHISCVIVAGELVYKLS